MTGAGGPVAIEASGPITGEAAIIDILVPLTARFPGAFALKDDCAVLAPTPGFDLVLKTDAVAEGVHFFADDAAADIGWKALAVNVSDLVAKGARPRVYLMALAFPAPPSLHWLNDFARGLEQAQTRFGITLAGGDTDRRPGPLSITIAAIGEVPSGRMVRRAAAEAGDLLYVSGTLGDAALGLKLRSDASHAAQWGLAAQDALALVQRYFRPEPRLALAPALLDHARAAMDLSDGLVKDLGRMMRASGTAAVVHAAKVPLSKPAAAALARTPALLIDVLTGGDDYEVLAAVAPDRAKGFEQAAAAAGIAVARIGETTHRGPETGFVVVRDHDGRQLDLVRSGWDHF